MSRRASALGRAGETARSAVAPISNHNSTKPDPKEFLKTPSLGREGLVPLRRGRPGAAPAGSPFGERNDFSPAGARSGERDAS